MSDCATAPEVSTSLSQPDAEVEDVEMRHIEIQAAPLDMLGALLTSERSDRLMSGMARGRTTSSITWRAAAIAGSESGRAAYIGANPAEVSNRLRSRSGTSRRCARRRIISRLGSERPVST